jgi:hypothetical protein
LRQPLLEGRPAGLRFRVVRGEIYEEADPAHPLWLLRTDSERPRRRRAAEQRDETSPIHSITSSARASSIDGTSIMAA